MENNSFYILDLDRTLVQTDGLRELYEKTITEIVPDLTHDIAEARTRHKSNFDLVSYVRMELLKKMSMAETEQLLASIDTLFVKRAQKRPFLEPFAYELLQILKKKGLSFGILTTGGNAWQQLKIEAARLQNIPRLIIHDYEKGRLISAWRRQDGTYVLPKEFNALHVKSLTFLDDKTVSFTGIPDDVMGIRVISITAQEPFEKDTALPSNVRQVRGLEEVAKLLFPELVIGKEKAPA